MPKIITCHHKGAKVTAAGALCSWRIKLVHGDPTLADLRALCQTAHQVLDGRVRQRMQKVAYFVMTSCVDTARGDVELVMVYARRGRMRADSQWSSIRRVLELPPDAHQSMWGGSRVGGIDVNVWASVTPLITEGEVMQQSAKVLASAEARGLNLSNEQKPPGPVVVSTADEFWWC